MSRKFDFGTQGKRLPYATPDGFFEDLEDNVWKAVGDGFQDGKTCGDTSGKANPKKTARHRWRLLVGGAAAVAASVAIVFALSVKSAVRDQCTVMDVDQAFSQLSADDQDFLLTVYQEDVFIRE